MTSKNQMIIKVANSNEQYIFNDLSDDSIKVFKLTIDNDSKFFTFDNNNGAVMIAKDKIAVIEIRKQ